MRSGSAGIGGAAFVLAAVLVSAPLYVASVASAALQRQFDERCPARIGLVLPAVAARSAGSVLRSTGDAMEGARGMGPPVRTTLSDVPFAVAGLPDGVADVARVLHRPGALEQVEVLDGPEGSGAWVPHTWAAQAGLELGDTVTLVAETGVDFDDIGSGPPESEPTSTFSLPVAAVYRDLSGLLPPAAWCLESDVLAPTPNGDPPPPLLLLDDAALGELPVPVAGTLSAFDRLPVRRAGLTTTIASDLVGRFDVAGEAAVSAQLAGSGFFPNSSRTHSELPSVLARAEGISDLVRANVRPVQLAGAVAGTTLALAAGLLATRRRQRELTTRAVRGEGPLRLAVRLAGSAVLPIAVGVGAGAAAAHVAVRTGGPSVDLGSVLPVVLVWSAAAATLTISGVAVSAASVVGRLADPPPPHRHRRWLAVIPWELAAVPVVVVAGRRLADVGGAQFLGNETTGVDAWAMAFPMLASTVAALVLMRPVVLAARRLRRALGGADPAAMLAVRRLAHDPVAAAAVAGAVALASATAVLGGALSASAARGLEAKAATFVGADAAVTIAGSDRTLPEELAGSATLTFESRAESGSRPVVVLGIDPRTFARGATTDAGDRQLVERLAAAGRGDGRGVPAIVVGALPDHEVVLSGPGSIAVHPVARAPAFPTSRSSSTLVVVDADALADARTTAVVLGRGPGEELEAALTAAGRRVTGVVSVEEIVTGTSIAAVRWAYAALRALGAVVVAVLLGVQLARSSARVRQRQLGEVFTSAMGMSRRRAAIAEIIEHGLPVAVGLATGVVVALLTAAVAVPDLDSARILPPRTTLVVPMPSVLVVVAVAALTLAAVVVGGRRQARRARAAVVLRSG